VIDQGEADAWATVHIGYWHPGIALRKQNRGSAAVTTLPPAFADAVVPVKTALFVLTPAEPAVVKVQCKRFGNRSGLKDPIFQGQIKTTNEYHQQAMHLSGG